MNCKVEGCGKATVGKSSYCRDHRTEARTRFKQMITEKAEQKAEREVGFAELWQRACEAGQQEVTKAKLEMVVAVDPDGRTSTPFPICGFAWVNVKPGNSAFANWLKKNNHARADSYYGGVCIWIHQYGQSVDMKYAYARGMAEVFSNAGIKAYASSRLD